MVFRKKTTSAIGLDISDLSIKFVQLSRSGNKIKISALGQTNLPEGIIVDGEIKNKEEAQKALDTIISKPLFGSITNYDVVACLPETKTFLKLVKIDNSPNQLEDLIPAEIEKHIPYKAKNLYFDWQKIENKNDKDFILVGAIEKSIANDYIELLNKSKLYIIALEAEAVAISRSLLDEESPKYIKTHNKNYCIIDIGAKRSSMIIYSKNTIVTTISMPISGNKITKRIAKTLEIDHDQAEKAKIICGLDKTMAKGIVSKILSDMTKSLIKKVQDSIDFYYEHYPEHGDIDNIILCGGGANINGLDKLITKNTSIETLAIDPLKKLFEPIDTFNKLASNKNKKEDKKIETQNQNFSYAYTTAIGLALRNIL